MKKKIIILFIACCFLSACAAAGVVASSDPRQKLKDAYSLLRENRPYPAERLIREAMEGFKEQNNSYELGLAQLMYGQFVKSQNFDWPLFRGQYPNTETAEQRNTFALPYFKEAINNFRIAASDPKLSHDTKSGYYWREYLAHRELKDSDGMCSALRNMKIENDAFMKENPGAKVNVNPPYKTFDEFMSGSMQDAHCKDL